MIPKPSSSGLLTGNMLKIIAAISMLLDHVGLMFFPEVEALRILGRLALPIFAYMIAEGCHHTKNRLRYFLQIFTLAVLCQTVYFLVDGSLYMSILVTFSCSILMVFALQRWRSAGEGKLLWGLISAGTVAAVYVLNTLFTIDYGFWGCMLPVFPSLLRGSRKGEDKPMLRVLMMALGLLVLSLDLGGSQIWSLAAVPLLLLYSGQRGRLRMKYFFYIFYPLHLAVLQLIGWLI